jgi:hypothetical protein
MLEPFTVGVSDETLEDLRRRLGAARLPPGDGTGHGWEDGTSPGYLREPVGYWRDRFDWRAQEALLNRFSHRRGTVDGTATRIWTSRWSPRRLQRIDCSSVMRWPMSRLGRFRCLPVSDLGRRPARRPPQRRSDPVERPGRTRVALRPPER